MHVTDVIPRLRVPALIVFVHLDVSAMKVVETWKHSFTPERSAYPDLHPEQRSVEAEQVQFELQALMAV